MFSRLIIFSITFLSLSIANATTLKVLLTSTLSGTVTNTVDSKPLSGVTVDVKWTTDIDTTKIIGSTSVTTGANGKYSVTEYNDPIYKYTGVSPITKLYIVYTYTFTHNGILQDTIERTEPLTVKDINIYNAGTEIKYETLSLTQDANATYNPPPPPPNPNPLNPGLTFNNTFNDLDDTITIRWTNYSKAPVNHWISVTPAQPFYTGPACNNSQTGMLLGSALNVGTNNPSGPHSFTFTPTLPATSYRVNICPVYNATTLAPGTCKDASDNDIQCLATVVVGNSKKSSIENLADFQAVKAVSQSAALSTNWANLGESWYYSPKGSPSGTPQWYYYVPSEKALYEDTPNAQTGPAGFLADRANDTLVVDFNMIAFNKYFSNFPEVIKMPIYNGLIDSSLPSKEALYMAVDDKLHISKPTNFAKNWSGIFQEKWALSEDQQYTENGSPQIRNRNWIYILPSGAIYRWDGVSSGANLTGRLLHIAPADYYTNFELSVELFEKYTQGIFGFANGTSDLNYNFSFVRFGGTEHEEYWIKSRRNNTWYYILPTVGAVYRFEGVYPLEPRGASLLYILGNGTYNKLTTRLLNFPY